ncbi:MAG: diphosphomevalonate/mevalonate 3,5-bisphosphate decarboxylase family protein [Candidatus Odinarchaeota archaeon]
MMEKQISYTLKSKLKEDYNEILQYLLDKDYTIQNLPSDLSAKKNQGETYTLAYPIQGILKYHGIVNEEHRISYFPSISLNNDCSYTITYLKFDENLKEDLAFVNGKPTFGEVFERIKFSLSAIRRYSKIKTKAILISRNFLNTSEEGPMGKGLGTSASGSSALALAAISIIYNNDPLFLENKRLLSIYSRYLSGSGCRSASGGFALWLSYPDINSLDSFAIRLDRKEHRDFINNISLITIPIQSDLRTNQVHKIAPKSPFFPAWLEQRKRLVFEFFEALNKHDLNKIGELAEYDTMCLHSVTMTAQNKHNIIAWEPDTLKIMQKIHKLRINDGYNVYYSIDTGPSLVLLTFENEKKEIINELKTFIPKYDVIEGKIGGSPMIVSPKSFEAKKLKSDIEKFNRF